MGKPDTTGQHVAGDATWTAVDMGSNSFCLLQGTVDAGRVTVTGKRRRTVRLMAGIDHAGRLDPAREAAALDCLHWFGEITRGLDAGQVRVVATSAVRRMADAPRFLGHAAEALGHPVHLISGPDEARLVWRGAQATLPANNNRRLIIDIGGGSTECIAGNGHAPSFMTSLDIGCIVAQQSCFADGAITAERWREALDGLGAVIAADRDGLLAAGWDEAWATSGSARVVGKIVRALGTSSDGISAAALADLKERLLAAGHRDRLELPKLREEGRQVIAGTVSVVDALFTQLGIRHMDLGKSSMREGILLELAETAARHTGH